jgi:hypothetical protein
MSASGQVSRTRNVLANWGGYIFAAGVNFVLSPFVVHSLGDNAYGIWVLRKRSTNPMFRKKMN